LEKEKFDILHFHNFTPPFAWQILEKSNCLNVLTLHANPRGSKFLYHFPGLLDLWRKMINRKIDGLIGVSSLTLKGFENFQGPKTVIPNGIDLTEFNPEAPKVKKYDEGQRKINLLFVGRIEERKGLIYLLKAYQFLARNLPPKLAERLRLLIVGEGPLKKECQRFVREQGLREIYFEGEKTNQELVSYYNTADIFVSPAIFGESFGLVLIEAMACGKPVIAFAIEGYKEVLTGKGARFLAKPRDSQSLAEKLEILIKNEKLRKEMGRWELKEAQKYSWPKVSKKVLDFYQLCKKEKLKI
jgi:phosphatidylinositol alpha-mannosyltransferase